MCAILLAGLPHVHGAGVPRSDPGGKQAGQKSSASANEPRTARLAAQLAQQFNLKVVAHLPETWQGTAKGQTLAETLRQLETAAGIRWSTLPGALSIGPSAQPGQQEIRQKLAGTPRYQDMLGPAQDLLARMVVSFSPEQIAEFRAGRVVPASALSERQLKMIQGLFAKRGRSQEFTAFAQQGAVECLISQPFVMIFTQGVPLQPEWVKEGTLRQHAQEHRQRTAGKDLAALDQWARQWLVPSARVKVSALREMSVGEICEMVRRAAPRAEFVVSRLVQEDRVVVTPGEYGVAELLALTLFAARAAIRKVGTLIHVAPDTDLRHERDTNLDLFAQAELWWRDLRPIISALAENPHSRFVPFDRDTVGEMKLVTLADLTAEQRRFVLARYDISEERSKDIPASAECVIAPMIECRFSYRDNPRRWWGAGLTPLLHYDWLVARKESLMRR